MAENKNKLKIIFGIPKENQKKSSIRKLDFDSIACAHLLLQMNYVQNLFELQIITLKFTPEDFSLLKDQNLFDWFARRIQKFEGEKRSYGIDYWIGITSDKLGKEKYFQEPMFTMFGPPSGLFYGLISSGDWEKRLSPPSLFEYITVGVFTLSLRCLNLEFKGSLNPHRDSATRGCIFDYLSSTISRREHLRIIVSNPNVCNACNKKLLDIETLIKNQTGEKISVLDEVNKVLSKKWMGSPKTRDTPIFNLKRNYGYDLDRNSGFYKKPWEKFRDSITDKSAEWIIGGISTLLFGIVLAYITATFNH